MNYYCREHHFPGALNILPIDFTDVDAVRSQIIKFLQNFGYFGMVFCWVKHREKRQDIPYSMLQVIVDSIPATRRTRWIDLLLSKTDFEANNVTARDRRFADLGLRVQYSKVFVGEFPDDSDNNALSSMLWETLLQYPNDPTLVIGDFTPANESGPVSVTPPPRSLNSSSPSFSKQSPNSLTPDLLSEVDYVTLAVQGRPGSQMLPQGRRSSLQERVPFASKPRFLQSDIQ